MSTFYLLPPRPLLGDRLAEFLHNVFPGLDWNVADRMCLVDSLGAAATSLRIQSGGSEVHVVFRDDLPPGEAPARALVDGFGAEVGDEVVEVRPTGPQEALSARRWRIERG